MTHTRYNNYVDLHLHTTASDGRLLPSELVEQAIIKGRSAIAITDHDTTAGINSAIATASNHNIEVIAGVEFSVQFVPTMHILALYVDIENIDLKKELNRLEKVRCRLIAKAFYRIRQFGINISPYKLREVVGAITISNLKMYLISENMISKGSDIDIALQDILNDWKKALPSPKECISLIHKCGGLAFLAHPILLGYSNEMLETIICNLKQWGLDGIEVEHPAHSSVERKQLDKMLQKYSLIKSGGSDYHGNKYNMDETIEISNDILKQIKFLRKEKYDV